jgi:hypothetical protein
LDWDAFLFSRCVAEGQHANGCQCVDIESGFEIRETWASWLTLLAAVFALPMTRNSWSYRQCTGRATPPSAPFSEVYLCCGRRAGKSFALALIATFLATFRDYRPHLQPGERATRQFTIDDKFSPLNW